MKKKQITCNDYTLLILDTLCRVSLMTNTHSPLSCNVKIRPLINERLCSQHSLQWPSHNCSNILCVAHRCGGANQETDYSIFIFQYFHFQYTNSYTGSQTKMLRTHVLKCVNKCVKENAKYLLDRKSIAPRLPNTSNTLKQ